MKNKVLFASNKNEPIILKCIRCNNPSRIYITTMAENNFICSACLRGESKSQLRRITEQKQYKSKCCNANLLIGGKITRYYICSECGQTIDKKE